MIFRNARNAIQAASLVLLAPVLGSCSINYSSGSRTELHCNSQQVCTYDQSGSGASQEQALNSLEEANKSTKAFCAPNTEAQTRKASVTYGKKSSVHIEFECVAKSAAKSPDVTPKPAASASTATAG